MRRINCTARRAQAFSRRWEGKTFDFFPFPFRFLLFLALLVNTA